MKRIYPEATSSNSHCVLVREKKKVLRMSYIRQSQECISACAETQCWNKSSASLWPLYLFRVPASFCSFCVASSALIKIPSVPQAMLLSMHTSSLNEQFNILGLIYLFKPFPRLRQNCLPSRLCIKNTELESAWHKGWGKRNS